jgi:hypothetical protein
MPNMHILDGDRLKGKAPKRWIEYTPAHGRRGYVVPDIGMSLETEEMCELLAEIVERHEGSEEANKAFLAGFDQLEKKDFAAEWLELQRKIYKYQRWGGPVPEAVFFPDEDNPKGPWKGIVPNEIGDPIGVSVRPGVFEDIIPAPKVGENVVKADTMGYYAIPPRKTVARRREMRDWAKAQLRKRNIKQQFVPD